MIVMKQTYKGSNNDMIKPEDISFYHNTKKGGRR